MNGPSRPSTREYLRRGSAAFTACYMKPCVPRGLDRSTKGGRDSGEVDEDLVPSRRKEWFRIRSRACMGTRADGGREMAMLYLF